MSHVTFVTYELVPLNMNWYVTFVTYEESICKVTNVTFVTYELVTFYELVTLMSHLSHMNW